MKRFAVIIGVSGLFVAVFSASSIRAYDIYQDNADIFQRGVASFYANKFNGRRTANGEIFNNSKMTAAHKRLKFGTKVRVTNRSNGRQVTVRINDRGPFIKGRIIDLSRAAAREIGMINRGTARVNIEIVK